MYSIIKNKKRLNLDLSKGFSLVEILMYISILILVTFVTIQSIIHLVSSHRVILVNRSIEYSTETAMNKMLNEIRNATTINSLGSSFDVNPGTISISGSDEGVEYTIIFTVQNGIIVFSKDGGSYIPLISSDVTTSSLIFRNISNTNSKGVKVEMTLSSNRGNYSKNIQTSGFSVLRGSY